eukprot:GFUD01003511.1.p1 GENE.GFUD01003511.1~~GFUD01003511.1.p1  ORF type:complete len:233 (+),score=60.77 GFUD01003511.1:27-725(+)
MLARTSSLLLVSLGCLVEGLGPAYGGDEFVRLKEIPPAMVAARSSGSLTLTCSVTGSPTPTTAWYKEGKRLSGIQISPGGLGETYAKLHLPCISEGDAGVYECRGGADGKEVVVATKVEVVGHSPHSGCLPKARQGAGPTITGWFSTVMIQSGETARLVCNLEDDGGKKSVIWRDAAGSVIKHEGRYKMDGTDLLISQANWADMGRFTCTAQNGFGVDMVSSFLYPLAPAFF